MTDTNFQTALELVTSRPSEFRFVISSYDPHFDCSTSCYSCPLFTNTCALNDRGYVLTSSQVNLLHQYYPEFFI